MTLNLPALSFEVSLVCQTMVPPAFFFIFQNLATLALGQLDLVPDNPGYDYEILPNEAEEDGGFQDYIPIHNEKERRFLEGLVIEAGRHTLFPQLYAEVGGEGASNENSPLVAEPLLSPKGRMKFYEINGQPEYEQSYLNRKRDGRAQCPEDCPIYKPVCGNDGKVYQSHCHLLRENCGLSNITHGKWETCRGKHYLCPSHCLDISDPVCASDGRIYQNICIMRKRNCGKLLQVLSVRKCYEDIRQAPNIDSCPEKCPEISKPVCGSDGVIYFNECFMKMQTCKLGVIEVEMENCVYVPKCPEVCLPFYDPVCSADGRLYINQCRMLQENCGKDVKKMPASFCSSAGQGKSPLGSRP